MITASLFQTWKYRSKGQSWIMNLISLILKEVILTSLSLIIVRWSYIASGGDGIPAELFQIPKDDAVKVLHSICQHIWKTHQWPQDRKRSVFIPIPKTSNAKECSNYCTIALISHASKVMLKISKPGFTNTWTVNSLMFKLVLEKARDQRSNCQHLLDQGKSKRVPEKHPFLLYWLCQSLWLCGSQ